MRKPTLPKFSGVLNQPILAHLLFPLGVKPDVFEHEEQDAYRKTLLKFRLERLFALLKHYNIPQSEDCWLRLSLRLAVDFVPGMSVVNHLPKRARPRERWGLELAHQFCDVVDVIRARKSRLSIVAAIKIAQGQQPKKWGRYKVSTLETRYHELKKAMRSPVRVHPQSKEIGLLAKLFAS